jgi:predicted nucleic acid-binding protein
LKVSVFIPDASVLLKWVLKSPDEADSRQALALRTAWLEGHCQLWVPSVWAYEVGNILGLKAPRRAKALLSLLFALDMEEIPARQTADRAFELMGRHGVTFYDAVYHAAALLQDGRLVTADARYLAQTASTGHAVLLRDWAS